MKKIGLYLNGELMAEYPFISEAFLEVAKDCVLAIEETGMLHEIKVFEE